MLIKRYLRLIQAYSQRQQRNNASSWIEGICATHWKVVELGHGRGRLGRKDVTFIEADPRQAEIPDADLVVFLGLAEKIGLGELSGLLGRIPAKRILFSFAEPRPGSRLWLLRLFLRGPSHRSFHHADVISELLEQHGYKKREIRRSLWFGSGKLVFAEKPLKRAAPSRRAAHSAP